MKTYTVNVLFGLFGYVRCFPCSNPISWSGRPPTFCSIFPFHLMSLLLTQSLSLLLSFLRYWEVISYFRLSLTVGLQPYYLWRTKVESLEFVLLPIKTPPQINVLVLLYYELFCDWLSLNKNCEWLTFRVPLLLISKFPHWYQIFFVVFSRTVSKTTQSCGEDHSHELCEKNWLVSVSRTPSDFCS